MMMITNSSFLLSSAFFFFLFSFSFFFSKVDNILAFALEETEKTCVFVWRL